MRIISFEVNTETWPSRGVSEYDAQNQLSGGASSGWPFYMQDDWQGLTLHPSYVIGGTRLNPWYPVFSTSVYVAFGPHAEDGDVKRLINFDLSCLTRWRPCREPGDLMPEAVAQHTSEEPQLAQLRKDHVCRQHVVALMARDAEFASVAEVTGIHPEELLREGKAKVPTVRMIENFKSKDYWKPGEYGDIDIYDVNTDRVFASLPSDLRVGHRFILLAQFEKPYGVIADPCGIVPLNPVNLDLVKQAIAGSLPSAKP